MATSAIPMCPKSPRCDEILPRIPITARLAGLALLFSASIGIPLGVISAVNQGTRLDYALRVVSLSGLSLPSFWLGLLILMASVSLFGTMPIFNPNPKTWTEAIAIYCVPAMAVGFRSAALTMRITRSSMLEILRQDYIRTARAKGASERSVNYHHALKNAILPVITVIGIEAAFLIGGLIVTETVFNIPGVARFLVEALRWRDYPIVQNLVMLIARGRGARQLHGRHALRRDRSAHPLHGLGAAVWPSINYDSELRRAGAHATHGWRRLTFLAQRYMLGTIGLVIMVLFVLAAAFGRSDLPVRSAQRRFRASPGGPQRAALAGHRFVRPRRLEPDRPWRAHLARRRHRLDRARARRSA